MFRTSSSVLTLIARYSHREHGPRWTHLCANSHPSLRAALTSSKCGSSKNSQTGHSAGSTDMVRLSFSSPIQLRNINLSQTHSKPPFYVCSTRSKKLLAQPSNRRHSSPMSYLSQLWGNFANLRSKSYWRRSTSLFSEITRKLRWTKSLLSSQSVAIWFPRKLLRRRPLRPPPRKRSSTNKLQRSAPTSCKPTL